MSNNSDLIIHFSPQ